MSRIKKPVELTDIDRAQLTDFVRKGKRSVQILRKAQIILELDVNDSGFGVTDAQVAAKVGVCRQTVLAVRKEFLANSDVSAFLQRKKRETPPVPAKITGDVEAHIIALACSAVPEGYASWSLRLLSDTSVELGYCSNLSHMSVGRVLKKHNLNLT